MSRTGLLGLSLFLLLAGATGTAAAAPAATERETLNRETFDWVWTKIADTYWDPQLGGVDWTAVAEELRPRAIAAESDSELRSVLSEMLGRLGQSHFGIVAGPGSGLDPGSAGSALEESAEAAASGQQEGEGCSPERRRRLTERLEGEQGGASLGLDLRLVGGSATVTRIDEGGPAASAGVAPGWIVRSIDGIATAQVPACLGLGTEEVADRWVVLTSLTRLLEGDEGSEAVLELVDGTGELRSLTLERRPGPGEWIGFGNLPPLEFRFLHRSVETPDGRAVSVIGFSAWLMPLVEDFERAYLASTGADGLVIDLRGNPGGIGGLVMGISGFLVDRPDSLGSLLSRRDRLEFRVNPRRVGAGGEAIAIFDRPVAVLVDGMTASTSEIFAAGLQDLGRARVFGETTMGAALPAMLERMPNGDLLMHAIADFLRPSGERIEGTGVAPDEPVPLERETLLAGGDPVLERSLRWIDRQHAEAADPAPDSDSMP